MCHPRGLHFHLIHHRRLHLRLLLVASLHVVPIPIYVVQHVVQEVNFFWVKAGTAREHQFLQWYTELASLY